MAKEPGSVFFLESKGVWRGVVYVKDKSGKSKPVAREGKTAKIVRAKLRKVLEQYDGAMPNDQMDVDGCCDSAIELAEELGRKSKTTEDYKKLKDKYISPKIGKIKVKDLKPAHIEEMMRDMGDLAPQTVILTRNFLRSALNRVAIRNGIIAVNPAALAIPPKKEHKRRRRLTEEDVSNIINKEPNPVFKALWIFLAGTGLRPSEARLLTWPELHKREDGWWLTLKESKTPQGKKPRPISNKVMDEVLKLGKQGIFVFPSKSGKEIHERNMRREWAEAVKRAKLEDVNLYQLRKFFATMKARTVRDDVLHRILAHTDVRTTKQYYVDSFDEDLRKAVED